MCRYFRHNGKNVYFNTGIDEHGIKVYNKSVELGIDISEHISNLSDIWIDFCHKFDIHYDNFYRTSDKSHHEKVKIVWNRFLDRGDIYKKNYEGKYCVGCESFKTDKEVIDGKCVEHQTLNLLNVNEENYFFKLKKYRKLLAEWIESNPQFLEPSSKLEELKNLIWGCDDISISRLKSNCPWGVEVPNDDKHIIYVWYEALLNYIFAAGYLTPNFKWDNVIQICGPDNLRFQGVIFQAFLQSEGIKKTDKLLVHGTILDKDGKKISKSVGNVIDPIDQLQKYGINAVRYYSLCGLSTYSNSSWNDDDLVRLWNNDICNDWGNLVSRTLHLIDTKLNGETIEVSELFKSIVDTQVTIVNQLWKEFKIKDALQKTNDLVKLGNKYVNDEKPWSVENPSQILSNLYYLINIISELYYPAFPGKYQETKVAIGNKKKEILFNKII